jgi:predicted  nucleic acid-binding Zn-ribbon protein
VEALLALQTDDEAIDALRARLETLAPRAQALDGAREAAVRRLNQARGAIEEDERRQRELEGRISEHKQRHERNLQHLDAVKRMREATAAMLQVEAGRKMLAEEESELRALVSRISDARSAIRMHEQALADLEASQAAERQVLDEERGAIEEELAAAREARAKTAAGVPSVYLAKYERIRSRRSAQAVFQLADGACACCDTAIPVQRRIVMSNSGSIEVCETCGVLLYAME